MYFKGQGVAQNYVEAHKWFNLAGASAADAEMRDRATKNRDIVAAKMQPAQIAEAQRLASAWRRK
jgi:TPR repeat protein